LNPQAEGRLCEVEVRGGAAEVPFIRDRDKRSYVPELQVLPRMPETVIWLESYRVEEDESMEVITRSPPG
jgi:hypothetical protein